MFLIVVLIHQFCFKNSLLTSSQSHSNPFNLWQDFKSFGNLMNLHIATVNWTQNHSQISSNGFCKIEAKAPVWFPYITSLKVLSFWFNAWCSKFVGRNCELDYLETTSNHANNTRVLIFFKGDVKTSVASASLTFNETQNGTLHCIVSGCLNPLVSWKKNGTLLNRYGGSLTLAMLNRSDAGQYSCHAQNGYTNASSQIQVIVNCK